MSRPNFSLAASKVLSPDNVNKNTPKYQDGASFLSYKNSSGRYTQWNPTSSSISSFKQQMNLPTDTTKFRNAFQNDSISLGNEGNKDFVFSTATLSGPSADSRFCTSDADCSAFEGATCNSNRENWNDVYGNDAGSVCNYTVYPELKDGVYTRKLQREGGIGKSCFDDSGCGEGYSCNNETNTFGSNIQQNGFCAQKYTCPDGKESYLGTPYNSAVPIEPPASQNNNGKGYQTNDECKHVATAQQQCVASNGAYFAVFPGFCKTEASLRKNETKGTGALRMSSLKAQDEGFVIPGFHMSLPSSTGSKKGNNSGAVGAFLQGYKGDSTGMSEPLAYSLKINGNVA